MIDEPKPWIRGSPKSIVVIVAHTGAQGEFSSQGEFILAIEGPDSRPRWPAGDKGKKRIDVVIALVLLQVLLELGAQSQVMISRPQLSAHNEQRLGLSCAHIRRQARLRFRD